MTDILKQAAARRIAFVTGGSGFVGGHLIGALLDKGWDVRALARSRDATAAVEKLGATAMTGELDDRAALERAMQGTEVVFHVAAHFKLWGPRALFDKVNVAGMRALVDAAAGASSVRRVVAVSAAAVVMGDPEPMIGVVESAPRQNRSFTPYGSSKAAGEAFLLAANGKRPGFETIAIRPPMIWGKGMPTLDHMVETVRAGRWQWPSGGDQAMSALHVDNLVDALILAADRGKGGETYFVADAEDGTLKSVIGGLLATRGVDGGTKSIGFGTAWTTAGIMGAVWRIFRLKGEPPITRQMLRLIGQPFTVRIDKARRDLGYVPRVSWKQGIDEMSGRAAALPVLLRAA
ncbi:NAD-dependent epimerase/dehydratase family protein [Polymorphobacter sp. PAMC 29334]|uniref:NAD-dependent epimerase/dehydratase family protein n=1 Tax=Polymorphobacter sp. PAMC 29334 TaxID=2862331 RepID=UPI001C757CDC|nr:NAD-dependent epimerase/dehydratase family protein [Polymorphobacter sp. PAMC 29334]QYE34073.1 NAD-dependent epimerase/dehydratase family protein [Polymorphobacter sp. PAMC 29334]